MPFFAYKARSAGGQLLQGVLEGVDSGAVADQLFGTGATPIEIVPTKRAATAQGGEAEQNLWARLVGTISTGVAPVPDSWSATAPASRPSSTPCSSSPRALRAL